MSPVERIKGLLKGTPYLISYVRIWVRVRVRIRNNLSRLLYYVVLSPCVRVRVRVP